MSKIRNEDLVPLWAAAHPDVFAQEPKHVQDQYREAVEKARRKLGAASEPAAMPEWAEEENPPPRKVRGKQ